MTSRGKIEYNFEAFWFFVNWYQLSFGINISLKPLNLEVHLPFGFLAVGWRKHYVGSKELTIDTQTHYLIKAQTRAK